jgi:MFS transporter, ACS family, hexuronate transporter
MSTPENPPAKSGNFRWIVCLLLFFSVSINYLDRLVIGILKRPLSEQLGWSDLDYGYIAAAFSFAYAFGYLIGGRLMDRWGVKKGLPIFVFTWSCAAVAHGFCAYIGVDEQFRIHFPWFSMAEGGFMLATMAMPMTAAGFMLARIALGLTQGGNFPGAIKAVAEWYPVQERAFATGLFNAGTNIGAVVCPLLVPLLFKQFGWQATFYITGATGFIWVAVWWFIYDAPATHRWLSPEERHYILQGQPAAAASSEKVPWISLFAHRAVWAYVIASILAGPAWGFYQFFIPDFLDKTFDLELQVVGFWTGVFFIVAMGGGIAGGWLSGKLISKGWSVNAARKLTLLVCALCVLPVFLAPFAPTVLVAVLIVGLAGSAHQGWSANLFSFVSDTMPAKAISSVVGLGGFVAYFTGGFVNGFTGWILERTGSYIAVFAYFSTMYLISLLLIQILVPYIGVRKQS